MTDILDDLKDMQKQATTERSHYYVESCCRRAIFEIEHQRRKIKSLEDLVDGYKNLARQS